MTFTISAPDALRQSVEAATGGTNTVLYDSKGYPSIMVVVPRFNVEDIDPTLGSGSHPAFIVGGVQKSEIFIGKYQARVHDNNALSLPSQDPTASLTWDNADARCTAKGAGWHMMTNAEWAAIALWSHKNGFAPRGNTQWGRDYVQTYETGRRQDGLAPGAAEGTARSLTGSGPVAWYHNNSPAGIADLVGNVYEWVRGMRVADGEIQIIEANNAAVTGADHGEASALWKAVLQNGTLVAPGSANTLKWNASGVDGAGNPILATTITSQSSGTPTASQSYKDIQAAGGVTVPPLLKTLALFPHDTTMTRGNVQVRNTGNMMAMRGGYWANGAVAGVFGVANLYTRSATINHIGFRPAYVL